MKKIYVPMMRYGDKDFDEGFVGWGFNSYDDQIRDARSILKLVGRRKMSMLDLACGLGTYHKVWLEAGHSVTGIDLSDTFIMMAKNTNPGAEYRVENYYNFDEADKYDCVTLIDTPLEDSDLCRIIFRALKPGGQFIYQTANPDYQHVRGPVFKEHQSWREEDDHTIILTRNRYNIEIENWEYEEWHVDVDKGEIVVQHSFNKGLSFTDLAEMLMGAGFCSVGYYDGDGRPYSPGHTGPRAYYGVAYKSEL